MKIPTLRVIKRWTGSHFLFKNRFGNGIHPDNHTVVGDSVIVKFFNLNDAFPENGHFCGPMICSAPELGAIGVLVFT